MSVDIEPSELGFHRPFTREVEEVLRIKNPNAVPVAFKVKTTAPKQYCVRPNSGRIEPGHDVEVSVLLQAMKQEPSHDTRCRDKFLVQSIAITGDKEFTNMTQIWESVPKTEVQEKKIRVNWLDYVAESGSEPAATPVRKSLPNGYDATHEVPPPAYSSPTGDHSNDSAAPATDANTSASPESDRRPIKAAPPQAPSTAAAAATTVKNAAEATYEELKDQLAKAEAMISSMKQDATNGLRQRKVAAASDEKAPCQELAQVARQGTEGVPVRIVALLCLISFLLAYFFF